MKSIFSKRKTNLTSSNDSNVIFSIDEVLSVEKLLQGKKQVKEEHIDHKKEKKNSAKTETKILFNFFFLNHLKFITCRCFVYCLFCAEFFVSFSVF